MALFLCPRIKKKLQPATLGTHNKLKNLILIYMDTLIYQHRRNDTNEVFYVGIGKDEKRPYTKCNRNDHWKRIVKKHGYTTEILITELLWDNACEVEIGLIKYYGRRDLGTGTLVNMTSGGDGTHNLDEEALNKISIANKGKKHSDATKQKMSNAKKGIPKSEEHKHKMSESAKKRKRVPVSDETRAKLSKLRKGVPKSEEHKRKISEGLVGNTNWVGHHHTDESKHKMSESARNRKIQNAGTTNNITTDEDDTNNTDTI